MKDDFDINSMPQFDQQLQQINQQKQEQDEQSGVADERFIVFKTGNSYRLRLCWPVPPDGIRKGPFIFRNVHHDHGQGRTGREITCPSSDYIEGRKGFRMCPLCNETSKYYNDWQDHKNATSKDLYDRFKRVQRNVALVYVVSDSLNPSNDGKFMLIRVPKNVADYLRRKIFGWAIKKGEKELDPDQRVGGQAFLMDAGVDLVISVSTEVTPTGNFNSYEAEFLPKPTSVPVTQADVNRAGIELKFDEDFYKGWDRNESDKFLKEVVLGMKMEMELNGTPSSGSNTYDPTKDAGFDPSVQASAHSETSVPNANSAVQERASAQIASQPKMELPKDNNLDNILNELGINQ